MQRQVSSGPLFAYFFDIHPISLLCSHYVSNDFVCGDHVYYFALHRAANLFSAYLYLKLGQTPLKLTYVLIVKKRPQETATPADAAVVADAIDINTSHSTQHITYTTSSGDTSAFGNSTPRSSSSPSSLTRSTICLRSKLDVEYQAKEGKGVRDWFSLTDLQSRGGYSPDEDVVTIGILINDHSTSWVYSAADQLISRKINALANIHATT